MNPETTEPSTEKVEVNSEKRKHRWYHWLFLVVAVLLSLFNIFEGIIFDFGQAKLISANIQALLTGDDFVVAPDSMELVGDDIVYENTDNVYKPEFSPENIYEQWTDIEHYDISIEGTSEGAEIENDMPRGIVLWAGTEGEITITVKYLDWPYLTATKTVQVVKDPITYLDVTLSTDTELKCGQNSHLVVNNDDCSVDLERVNFYSTNENVASIDDEGYIKAVSEGTTEVYAVNAEDESVVSEKIPITVTEGTIAEPASVTAQPITMYAKSAQKVDAVFNNGNACDDCLYEITSDEDVVRQGEYLYSDVATGPVNIRVSSVYDPSVYCDTTVEFIEVKATGLSLVEPSNEYPLGRYHRFHVVVDVLSEVEGVDVTYDELSYDVIDGEDVVVMKNNIILPTEVQGFFTLRISLVNDPSIYIDVTYETYYDETVTNVSVLKVFGHFLPFMANGFLLVYVMYWFLYDEKKNKKSIIKNVVVLVLFVLLGFLISVSGEIIQLLLNVTRTASWSDVGINFSGFIIGFLVAMLIIFLYRLHKKNKAKKALTKGI